MPNPLFSAIMSGFKPPVNNPDNSLASQPQTPTEAQNAPQMNFQDAMAQLRSNPAQLMKQAGFNVPDEIASNPQASVMHLIQSGQVGGPMMQRIQPLLSRMIGRR